MDDLGHSKSGSLRSAPGLGLLALIRSDFTSWWRTDGHEYFVLPTEKEYAQLDEIAGHATNHDDLLTSWREFRDLERHEDQLFNSRFQSLLISNSFLVGAFFAIGESSHGLLAARIGLCFAGLFLTIQSHAVLLRSARAIEWYLALLIRIDPLVFPEGLQPYRSRRKLAGRLDDAERPIGGWTVMGRMAIVFPLGIGLLWIFLLVWTGCAFWLRAATASPLTSPPVQQTDHSPDTLSAKHIQAVKQNPRFL